MKNNILTVMKKELARFFGDSRMLFGTVLLPGLMIFLIYSLMGEAMGSLFQPDETSLQISAVHMPPSIGELLHSNGFAPKEIPASEAEDVKSAIAAKESAFLLVFPENFDRDVAAYEIGSGAPAPDISFYYNSSDTDSSEAYTRILALLDSYEATLTNKFDINRADGVYDLASERDLSAMMYSMMMPLLLTIFLFSACVSIGPESIAGEKERGTLSTLLVTPLRRRELAIGKILSLSIIALLSAVSSAVGTIVSLPKLMGGAADSDIFYTASDYLLLAVVILSTVLVFISLVAIISAFARTIQEAQTYISPLTIVIMLVGVSGMFASASGNPVLYLIPVYNSVQCMSAIFSYSIEPLNVLICVISNLVYSTLMAFVLTKMFNSEKIMFAR